MMPNPTSIKIVHPHHTDGYNFPNFRSRAINGPDTRNYTVGRETGVVPSASGMFRIRVRAPEIYGDVQEFRLPLDCTDVIFLRRGLVILYRDGFCTFDPTKCVSSRSF